MDLKQCPGCEATVDSQKAYCPDCGTPMEEEQKKSRVSEFDNLIKTQNINPSQQIQFLDKLNLSFIFASKNDKQTPENVEVENKSFKQPITPEKTNAQPQTAPTTRQPSAKPEAVSETAVEFGKKSAKKEYIVIGALVLAVLALFLIALVITLLGYIYFWQR
jgi:hypothetical protein